jgi:hypothetical protein
MTYIDLFLNSLNLGLQSSLPLSLLLRGTLVQLVDVICTRSGLVGNITRVILRLRFLLWGHGHWCERAAYACGPLLQRVSYLITGVKRYFILTTKSRIGVGMAKTETAKEAIKGTIVYLTSIAKS